MIMMVISFVEEENIQIIIIMLSKSDNGTNQMFSFNIHSTYIYNNNDQMNNHWIDWINQAKNRSSRRCLKMDIHKTDNMIAS